MPDDFATLLFENVINEGDHAWTWVCKSCADRLNLQISDACSGDVNICSVNGCNSKTGFVHYIFDYRLEVLKPNDVSYYKELDTYND